MARELISGVKAIEALKPTARKRLSDGGGLYLLPNVNGGSHGWRFDYTFQGKRKTLSLGVYPDIGLAVARLRAKEFRALVATGSDPSPQRKLERSKIKESLKLEKRLEEGELKCLPGSFKHIVLSWHAYSKVRWVPAHASRTLQRFENHLFPHLGTKMVEKIQTPDLFEVLEQIEKRGLGDTAHRLRGACLDVFNFAICKGQFKDSRNPVIPIKLNPVTSTPYAAVTDEYELGPMLSAMDRYQGSVIVRAALGLMPLVTLRPGALRAAMWEDIDLTSGWWRIPAARMKGSQKQKARDDDHWVPLPSQAKKILQELQSLTGRWKYVFPNQRSKDKPMSENAINSAFRSMGYPSDLVTAHGFRATARTIMDQVLHIDSQVLEVQLAHTVSGSHGSTYNRSDYREFRWFAMQLWADYLDALRLGKDEAERFVARCRAPFGPRRLDIEAWKGLAKAS